MISADGKYVTRRSIDVQKKAIQIDEKAKIESGHLLFEKV